MFGRILKIGPNSGMILKIRPNACHHLKNLRKLGLRPEFGLRTTGKSDLFYQVSIVPWSYLDNTISKFAPLILLLHSDPPRQPLVRYSGII